MGIGGERGEGGQQGVARHLVVVQAQDPVPGALVLNPADEPGRGVAQLEGQTPVGEIGAGLERAGIPAAVDREDDLVDVWPHPFQKRADPWRRPV